MTGTGYSPGKVILLGEHAVVYGHAALAAALPFGVTVRAQRADFIAVERPAGVPEDPRIRQAVSIVAGRFGFPGVRISGASDIPPGQGLGSSAAFAVALVRAVAELAGRPPPQPEIEEIALETERLFHGTPSGVDHTVCARGGILLYRRGPPPLVETVRPARRLPLVVAPGARGHDTGESVASLRARREREPAPVDAVLARLGELAVEGARDIGAGDLASLGARMNEAHELLQRCGVSTPELDSRVLAARRAGALGAKLTGAGGGGAMVALAPQPEPVLAALRASGSAARLVEVS